MKKAKDKQEDKKIVWPFPEVDKNANPIVKKQIKQRVNKNRLYDSVKDNPALI